MRLQREFLHDPDAATARTIAFPLRARVTRNAALAALAPRAPRRCRSATPPMGNAYATLRRVRQDAAIVRSTACRIVGRATRNAALVVSRAARARRTSSAMRAAVATSRIGAARRRFQLELPAGTINVWISTAVCRRATYGCRRCRALAFSSWPPIKCRACRTPYTRGACRRGE